MAVIHSNEFKCFPISFGEFNSFEHLLFSINNIQQPLVRALLYTVPQQHKPNFISDFLELSSFMMSKLVIMGDFNVHICCANDPFALDFNNLCNSFGLTQSVTGSTHNHAILLTLYYPMDSPWTVYQLKNILSLIILSLLSTFLPAVSPIIFPVTCLKRRVQKTPQLQPCLLGNLTNRAKSSWQILLLRF